MSIIELGGGSNPRFRPNVDCRKVEGVDIVADFEKPLPLPSEEYSMVYSQYVIEHISWRNLQQFINEIYRILKPSGKALIVTANLKAQAEKLLSSEKWELNDLCMIFGGLDYPENSHKSSMNPEMAERLFKNAGFKKVDVLLYGLDSCATDMTIEAEKMSEIKFSRVYFEGLGYKGRFYRDFYQHYRTAYMILDRKPESVLDVGGGRGYICRILQSLSIPATCMDISPHCWHTRATDDFILWDAIKTPWRNGRPNGKVHSNGMFYELDEKYDLCFSIAFLEHVPEDRLEPMIKEMARVSKRGLHGITVEVKDPAKDDPTHVTIKPLAWWQDLFKRVVPEYPVEILDKEVLENLPVGRNDTDVFNRVAPQDGLVKLNVGSFTDMYYYNWINIDIADLEKFAQYEGYRFERRDLRQGFTGIADNSVDIVLASHFLEHFNREDGKKFLLECKRVLKGGGLLRLAVPDSKLLADLYVKMDLKQFADVNIGVEHATDGAEAFYHLLLAGHQTIYDFNSLDRILNEIGFNNISAVPPFRSNLETIKKQTVPMYPTLSLYVEAFKYSTCVEEEKNRSCLAVELQSNPIEQYLKGKINGGRIPLKSQ